MFEKFIPLLGKIVRTITLNKVLVWSLTSAIGIIGYTAFERRVILGQIIFNTVPMADLPAIKISTITQTNIKKLVANEDFIAAVIILDADIRNNQRIPSFWYSDDTEIERSLDNLYLNKDKKVPLFSSDEKNNEEIVSVINGEFTCTAYDDAVNASIIPGMKDKFPYICRTSLPPYYGQFSGYIAVALHSLPDRTTLDRIKSESISIATEIYFRDILPQIKR